MSQVSVSPSTAFLEEWEVARTVQFIKEGGHQRVALQLPDDLLWAGPKLVAALMEHLATGITVAVLADSAFNPEAVDEVAAQHMSADALVHYGRASLVHNAHLPVLHVFPRISLDVEATTTTLAHHLANTAAQQSSSSTAQPTAVILLDQALQHTAQPILDSLKQQPECQGWHIVLACPSSTNTGAVPPPPPSSSAQKPPVPAAPTQQDAGQQGSWQHVCGYSWSSSADASSPAVMCWVGPPTTSALQALQLALSQHSWLRCTPAAADGSALATVEEGPSRDSTVLAKRRYFLVEKARSACILGILVGTLATAGLTDAMSHLRSLISAAGKRSYTVLVGKPNTAKLANFPEVEVWVQLSDPLGALMDSRPFLAPLITPQEAVLALTGGTLAPGAPLDLGLEPLMGDAQLKQQQLAAATAAFKGCDEDGGWGSGDEEGGALVATQMGGLSLQVTSGSSRRDVVKAAHGAEYLKMREWQGVEAPVAGADSKAPAPAVEGLSGRAAGYSQETQ